MLPEDQKRILGYFIEEAKDHLHTIEQGLLNLQATVDDPETINAVFRAAHSVKGGAAMLGLESIQRTSHRMEDYFKILKEFPIQANRELESMLLQVFDGLNEQLEQLQGPFGLTEDRAQSIMATLEPLFIQVDDCLHQLSESAQASPVSQLSMESAPAAAPPDVEVASPTPYAEASALQLVFKSDVPALLREMLALFKQPDTSASREQLREICQQLYRMGEQFELFTWCHLTEMTTRAVTNQAQTYRSIAPVVIKELKAAQDLVLRGLSQQIVATESLQELLPEDELSLTESGHESSNSLLEEAFLDASFQETEEESASEPLLNELEGAEMPEESDLASTEWLRQMSEPGMELEDTDNGEFAGMLDQLDRLSFEETDASSEEISGPAVGAAELNSLADLFEGEIAEFDQTWEEEVDEMVSTPHNDPLDASISDDFADLLLDQETDTQSGQLESDDFDSLFGASLSENVVGAQGHEEGEDLKVFQDSSEDWEGLPFDFEEAETEADNQQPSESEVVNQGGSQKEDWTGGDLLSELENHQPDNQVDISPVNISLEDLGMTSDEVSSISSPGLEDDLGEAEMLNLGPGDDGDFSDVFEGLEDAWLGGLDEDLTDLDTSMLGESGIGNTDVEMPELLGDEVPSTEEVDDDPLSREQFLSSFGALAEEDTSTESEAAFEDIQDWEIPATEADAASTGDSANLLEDPWTDSFSEAEFSGMPEGGNDVDSFFSIDVSPDDSPTSTREDASDGKDDPEQGSLETVEEFFDTLPTEAALQPQEAEIEDKTDISEEGLEAVFSAEQAQSGEGGDAIANAGDPSIANADDPSNVLAELEDLDFTSLSDLGIAEGAPSPEQQMSVPEVTQEPELDGNFNLDIEALSIEQDSPFENISDALGELTAETGEMEESSSEFEDFKSAEDWQQLASADTSDISGFAEPWEDLDSLITDNEPLPPDLFAADPEGEPSIDLGPTDRLELNVPERNDADATDVPDFSRDWSEPQYPPAAEPLLREDASDESDLPSANSFSQTEYSPDISVPHLAVDGDNIEDEFEDLEKLLEEADQLGGTPPSTSLRRGQGVSPRRVTRRSSTLMDQTMRVSVQHLDGLSNLVGELVVNRNSLEQDQERLRQFLDNLLFQVQQLNDVGQRMRDLYERSLLESSLISSRQAFQTTQTSVDTVNNHATGANFDALEMDRFTGFHTLTQEMIELIVRVRESASDIGFTIESTDQVTRQFRQVTTQLQEGLNKARMVPFAQTADRLPRAVRDISLKCGKEAKLLVEGRDTLIDKMILERLYDPMTHLVNNAITHGIETPEERVALGKPREGIITVRAFYQGNQTVIYIADDGAGINPNVVRDKAIGRGLITPQEAQEMSDIELNELLFLPGFSTRDQADDFAGRGVGMDVVRTALAEIRGVVTIDSELGSGTSFTIRLPLTLSISKALSCVNNQARIAFPMDGVEDMFDVPRERIQQNDRGQSCIPWRDTLLPFRPLSDLLHFNRTLSRGRVYGGSQEENVVSIVVLRSANTYIALQVDQVIGEQEIVIKQLEGPVPKPTGIAGATVLGDGRVMPIADVLELIDLSTGRMRRESSSASIWGQTGTAEEAIEPEPLQANEATVLIVDDSITVRELLSMSFNKVGYRVEQARDGQEAWEKLRSGLPCDLVFCDIEMPRMDGLELLSRMQKDSSLRNIPIAMLTSRGADRHRQMAVDLGAKGYFTKPYLEEVLLDAAERMLQGENMVTQAQG